MVLKRPRSSPLLPLVTGELSPALCTDLLGQTHQDAQVTCISCAPTRSTGSPWERNTLSTVEIDAGIGTASGLGAQGRSLICAV